MQVPAELTDFTTCNMANLQLHLGTCLIGDAIRVSSKHVLASFIWGTQFLLVSAHSTHLHMSCFLFSIP